MSAKETFRFCGTIFDALMSNEITFDTFEKTLLRKQKDLESKQEVFDIKEVVLDGKK